MEMKKRRKRLIIGWFAGSLQIACSPVCRVDISGLGRDDGEGSWTKQWLRIFLQKGALSRLSYCTNSYKPTRSHQATLPPTTLLPTFRAPTSSLISDKVRDSSAPLFNSCDNRRPYILFRHTIHPSAT